VLGITIAGILLGSGIVWIAIRARNESLVGAITWFCGLSTLQVITAGMITSQQGMRGLGDFAQVLIITELAWSVVAYIWTKVQARQTTGSR
jgi:hypothetical protein